MEIWTGLGMGTGLGVGVGLGIEAEPGERTGLGKVGVLGKGGGLGMQAYTLAKRTSTRGHQRGAASAEPPEGWPTVATPVGLGISPEGFRW